MHIYKMDFTTLLYLPIRYIRQLIILIEVLRAIRVGCITAAWPSIQTYCFVSSGLAWARKPVPMPVLKTFATHSERCARNS